MDSKYFSTCHDARSYDYEPYLRVACRNVLLFKKDDVLKKLFGSQLFLSGYRRDDIYKMLEENLPMKYIEQYLILAKETWKEKPMMHIVDIIKAYTESDGSISQKGIDLLHLKLKTEPCPDYRTCAGAVNYNHEAELKIYKEICKIFYKMNYKQFEKELKNAK